MYEKPELTLVGTAAAVVLGFGGLPVDNEPLPPGEPGEGLVAGLDE